MRRAEIGAALAAGVLLVSGATHGAEPAQREALHVSPAGSDANPCTAARPCLGFDRAYRSAEPGQIVEVAPGSYGEQEIEPDPDKTSPDDVVFRPAEGGAAAVAYLTVRGQHVTFERIRTGGWNVRPGADDVSFVGVEAAGAVFVTGASNVAVRGGSVTGSGRFWANGSQVKAASGSTEAPRNIVFDGVTFRDFRKDPASSDHVDCLHVFSGNGVVVRNSRFLGCEHFDLLFTVFGSAGSPTNVLVENNFFGHSMSGLSSVQFGGGHGEVWQEILFRYNSSDDDVVVAFETTIGQNVRFVANVVKSTVCHRDVTYEANVFAEGSPCRAGDRVAPSGFLDPAGLDLHLARGAAAIGRGPAGSAPAIDIDGQPRPRRWAADAGADQREPAAIVLGRAIGAVRLGMAEDVVREFYGRPQRVEARRASSGAKLRVASYRGRGGRLSVTYRQGTVVGVGTTSPFYETAGGLGPGAPVAGGPALWDECARAYRRLVGGVTVYVAPAGGRSGARIAAVSMVRRQYAEC